VNEAEGQAAAIRSVANAQAEAITAVANAVKQAGGYEAIQLRLAEQYIAQFGNIAKTSTTLIVPANIGDVAGTLATAMAAVKKVQ
jgi:regulator of protease activity HflC (stomatin/prohibitin superfamily)